MPMSASQNPLALWSTEMSGTEKQEKLHLYLQKCAADEGLTVEEIPNSPLTTPHSPGRRHSSGSQGHKERPKRFEELVAHARSRICVWIAKTSADQRASSTGEKGVSGRPVESGSTSKPRQVQREKLEKVGGKVAETIRKSTKESAQSPSEELAECLPGTVEEPQEQAETTCKSEESRKNIQEPEKDEKEQQNYCICLQHLRKS